MPQSHPPTAPVRFLSPVRFLARKAEWSARRNLTLVLFSWSHQATGPVRHDTAVHLWFGWIIHRTPRLPCAIPIRAPHVNFQCFSYHTGSVWGPCGTRKRAVGHPCGHVRELTQPELAKIPHGHRIWPYEPLTGCSWAVYNLKTCTIFVQNSPGTARRGPGGVWCDWGIKEHLA